MRPNPRSDGQPSLPVYEGVNEGYLLWGYGPPWAKAEHQLATLEDNQVRETFVPAARGWASFSLVWLHSHRNAWANLHLLGRPDTALAPVARPCARAAQVANSPTAEPLTDLCV
jgi:hypothetical protein